MLLIDSVNSRHMLHGALGILLRDRLPHRSRQRHRALVVAPLQPIEHADPRQRVQLMPDLLIGRRFLRVRRPAGHTGKEGQHPESTLAPRVADRPYLTPPLGSG